MPEPVKITQEELNEVKKIQEGYRDTIFALGQLYIHRLNMETAFKNLSDKEIQLQKEFENFQKKENDWTETITKKYGEGSLNIEKGEFVPLNPK